MRKTPSYRLLNNALLVFQKGSASEFSVEVDHVLITTFQIFVVETKFKSGTVEAKLENETWEVTSKGHTSIMRNALRQVKRSVGVIRRELNLDMEIIPMVAIFGEDVSVVEGPSNVVSASDLIRTIQAFIDTQRDLPILDTGKAERLLLAQISTDPECMARHIARANISKEHFEARKIVDRASVA